VAERFVHGLAYETLVRVDCLGRVRPALAASWAADRQSTTWTFVLAEGARWWNGDPLTAADVVASWRAAGTGFAGRLAESATPVDARRLTIQLGDLDPAVLAAAELSVRRRSPSGTWPEGTGAYRVDDSTAEGSLVLLDTRAGSTARMRIWRGPVATARDAVDAGTDLLLTVDPELAAYASRGAAFHPSVLPWTETYVLLAPARRREDARDSTARANARGGAGLDATGRDAVRADTRAAGTPDWWDSYDACRVFAGPAAIPPPRDSLVRVLFARDDAVARALAERLAALVGMRGSPVATEDPDPAVAVLGRAGRRAIAIGLAGDSFTVSVRARNHAGYVVALPRQAAAPCAEVERLLRTAPWLSDTAGASVIPLLDTRWRAVVRADRLGLSVDRDGTLRLRGSRDEER
jgi:hypothetical protein